MSDSSSSSTFSDSLFVSFLSDSTRLLYSNFIDSNASSNSAHTLLREFKSPSKIDMSLVNLETVSFFSRRSLSSKSCRERILSSKADLSFLSDLKRSSISFCNLLFDFTLPSSALFNFELSDNREASNSCLADISFAIRSLRMLISLCKVCLSPPSHFIRSSNSDRKEITESLRSAFCFALLSRICCNEFTSSVSLSSRSSFCLSSVSRRFCSVLICPSRVCFKVRFCSS